ncbi:MAG: DUF58 domain-containing protein [Candidatus Micrarchaeota archaeon]
MALAIQIDPAIKRLEIVAKQFVNSKLVGNYKSAFKGHGIEFDGYREYAPTDDASRIDWRASMRAGGKILVKEFVEERNLDVGFLVDTSATMVFGSAKKLKNEYAAEAVASLSYAMLEAGDTVGVGLFSKETTNLIPPKGGLKHYYFLLHTLADPKFYGGRKNYGGMADWALREFERGSLIFIVSDFIAADNEFFLKLKILAQKFDVVGLCVRDALDLQLPNAGVVDLKDSLGSSQLMIDTKDVAEDYTHYAHQDLARVKNEFNAAGTDFVVLDSSEPFSGPIIRLFNQRTKRLS